jgi:two-component system OmpR family sensor kinase
VNLTIKARLTLWYVVLFTIIAAAWGSYVLVRTRYDLYAGLDRSLSVRATQLAGVLRGGSGSAFKNASDSSLAGVAPTQAAAQLLSADGVVVQHSGDPVASSTIVPAEMLAAVRTSGRAQTGTIKATGESFRVLLAPLPKSDRLLLVGLSTQTSDMAIERLGIAMAFSVPIAILVTALMGWFIASRALRPLSRMTSTASSISINRLDERIPVPPAEDELRSLAETLNDMLGRLETGVKDKRRLVANASHELQTPLAVMRTELDVYLATADLPPDAVEVLASVREESDRMSRIVRNLLTLARFDDGNFRLLKQPLDLADVAQEAVDSLTELARERHVTVSADGESTSAPADAEYLRLVVTNLVENAIKYSGEGSEVKLNTYTQGEDAVLEVADNGQGIPASALPHLFDRFFRVESARAAENSGSGLGLAITKEIIEAHKGKVEVHSELDRGTTFILRLPKFLRTRSE